MKRNGEDYSHMAVLEAHMRSISQEAPTVHINRAQCTLVARRLQNIYYTLCMLPNPVPTPQLLTVFLSADMLIQRMKYDGWKRWLRSHYTCSGLFTGIFERIKQVWQLHSVASWAEENQSARRVDEVANLNVYTQLLRSEAERARIFRTHPEEGGDNGGTAGVWELGMDQVESANHHPQHGSRHSWKVPFEELTPPECSVCRFAATIKRNHLLFDMYYGYRYKDRLVMLRQLEPTADQILSPETLMGFVQDMTSRSRWCHPHIVPFVGAFAEKMVSQNETVSAGAAVAATPMLALGVIEEDVRYLVAQSVERSHSTSPVTSYFMHQMEARKSEMTYCSLHDLLFVQQRRFTLKEAIGITLQVSDALHYILMDAKDVPSEVAAAWVSVSPSNVFVCRVAAFTDNKSYLVYPQWNGEERSQFSPNKTSQQKPGMGHERCVELPAGSAFVAMYTPPMYVEGSPFSRWKPHPHAASSSSYALTQLLLSILRNEPPYRAFRLQQELSERVFDALSVEEDEEIPAVRVSVPLGCTIPENLPPCVRELCQHGLRLRRHEQGTERHDLLLAAFREKLRAICEHLETPASADTTETQLEQQHPQCYALAIGGSASPERSEHSQMVEMVPIGGPLDDYGEFSDGSVSFSLPSERKPCTCTAIGMVGVS